MVTWGFGIGTHESLLRMVMEAKNYAFRGWLDTTIILLFNMIGCLPNGDPDFLMFFVVVHWNDTAEVTFGSVSWFTSVYVYFNNISNETYKVLRFLQLRSSFGHILKWRRTSRLPCLTNKSPPNNFVLLMKEIFHQEILQCLGAWIKRGWTWWAPKATVYFHRKFLHLLKVGFRRTQPWTNVIIYIYV